MGQFIKDPTLIYVVSWNFRDGGESTYTVHMKESQAKLIEEILEKYYESGYIDAGSVEEVGDPISSRDLMKIITEEFPRTGKEWMP